MTKMMMLSIFLLTLFVGCSWAQIDSLQFEPFTLIVLDQNHTDNQEPTTQPSLFEMDISPLHTCSPTSDPSGVVALCKSNLFNASVDISLDILLLMNARQNYIRESFLTIDPVLFGPMQFVTNTVQVYFDLVDTLYEVRETHPEFRIYHNKTLFQIHNAQYKNFTWRVCEDLIRGDQPLVSQCLLNNIRELEVTFEDYIFLMKKHYNLLDCPEEIHTQLMQDMVDSIQLYANTLWTNQFVVEILRDAFTIQGLVFTFLSDDA